MIPEPLQWKSFHLCRFMSANNLANQMHITILLLNTRISDIKIKITTLSKPLLFWYAFNLNAQCARTHKIKLPN